MAKESRSIYGICVTLILLGWVFWSSKAESSDTFGQVAEEIRHEAALPNQSDIGRPLPLAATWNTGQFPTGFTPDYQMHLIEQGHYILPAFFLPPPKNRGPGEDPGDAYFEAATKKAAALKLPISFVGTEWESVLTTDPNYFNLPPDKNPNVIGLDGSIQHKLDPLGPVDPWKEVGKKWTSTPLMNKLQEWYPDPPLVLFVSNNEANRLRWYEAESSSRYISLYGKAKDDNVKRQVVGDGWIRLYRAFQASMREGLTQRNWCDNAKFIGYDAFGPSCFGRWFDWEKYSLNIPGRIAPWPLAWDGATPSYYLYDWAQIADNLVWSPQVESINWVFMLEEAHRLNPDFWFEISTWDGDAQKREYFTILGQVFNPERYGGMVKFGMWLLRPRVVREFRGYTDTVANAGPYFLAVAAAVDSVHKEPLLRKFWRHGELVANHAEQHPYQSNVPAEYHKVDRWFLLDTKLDPPRSWWLMTNLPVYSLALVLGQSPEREWLIYTYCPLGPKPKVEIFLPDYGQITIDASPSGVYYQVVERTKVIKRIDTTSVPLGGFRLTSS